MRHEFQVMVMLKDGLADPQGKAVEDAAPAMGWNGISSVRVGKTISLTVEAESADNARDVVEDMARRLLSNPVIEDTWVVSVEEGE